ncbi:enterochelin esterase [Streptomyces tagetis]|uniref:Enterochelin esterase n=1 Tax=Streptomyces tagetis TaxID=2820809 RepID=A0A940XIE0_9ACTN|nr:enterochelin esterase [Streptomyces sp. RG38]MBQ0827121.1 enterochelin esterase [Streptomyces sp. RG38]
MTAPASPALRALGEGVRAGVPGAEAAFRLRAARTGTPLVEADPEGDPDHRLVTFLWWDEPDRPATDVLLLLHTVTDRDRHGGDLTRHLMRRAEGTSLWWLSHRLRADHRASYQFLPGHRDRAELLRTDRASWRSTLDRAVPDPLSREPALPSPAPRRPASVLSLPAAPPQPYAAGPVPRAGGDLEREVDGRRVRVHLPPGHRASRSYPVAVLLDGEMWGPVLETGALLDRMHGAGALAPAVVLMVDTMERRMEDLSCNGAFVDWLAEALLPWARTEFGVTSRPERTLLAGQSAGGLTAAFAAYRRPDRFGLAVSQSGAFWWPEDDPGLGPEWLTRRYASGARRPVRLWLEVGLQEWMLLAENRRLRNVLRARGYEIAYREFNGGHDYACWRGGLADALADLLGPAQPETPAGERAAR